MITDTRRCHDGPSSTTRSAAVSLAARSALHLRDISRALSSPQASRLCSCGSPSSNMNCRSCCASCAQQQPTPEPNASEGAFPGLESPEGPFSESPAFIPPLGAAALPLGGGGEKRPERHMRNSGFPCEEGGSRGGSPFLPIVHHGGPPPVEVPDWSHGVFDPPPKNAPPQTESRIKIKFLDPFPPPTSAPSLASFSVYGSGKPREPLLLACHPLPEGQASCEVLSNKPFFQIPEESLYRGWSMGEGDRTATSSQHSLSTLAGEGDESPSYPASHSAQGQGLLCCEASSDAENCVTCSGIFNGSYDPLHAAPVAGGFYGPGGGEDEAPFEPTIGDRMPRGSSRKWPHSEDLTEPLSPKDLFKVLPQLRQQLGGVADVSFLHEASCSSVLDRVPSNRVPSSVLDRVLSSAPSRVTSSALDR
ncbi:uncharacterized protein LOC113146845, partial [Cyclospora cayetanensis]|uniref:Uncharacterized protein LOC113146845 n=1 Tax=Cyclospora cayetanensis TaxID=88456 RepID=A0A6P6RTQ5_9EIME